MPQRTVRVGVASFVQAASPTADGVLNPVWGFGLYGAEVDVHPADVERFDRLNGPEVQSVQAAPTPDPKADQPPRAGRGASLEAWVAYADKRGLLVPDGATRDEVIALVDDDE